MKLTKNGTDSSLVISTNSLAVSRSTSATWGWLPVLSLTSAVGVFLVALAANAGRFAVQWADPLFWFGLLVLYLPISVRIISREPARWERITLLFMLGGATYLFRFLDYPLYYAYTDEFAHWRGAYDLAIGGHLFQPNPLIPIIPFFPGMEIATVALSSLTGLSIFGAGSIVLVVGGLVLVLALYLFFEHLSDSAHMAGIATLIYMANPGWFSDTQFAYESLALPLAMFVLFIVARRNYLPTGHRGALTLAIWLGLAATVITHHLSSYALEGFLILWTGVFILLWLVTFPHQSHKSRMQPSPRGAAFVGLVLIVAWMAYTGWRVVPYLYTPFVATLSQVLQIALRRGAPRQLFQDGSGVAEPLWERVMGFASTALVSLGLPFGLLQLWQHHRYRTNALALALAIAALMYPVTQLARLTPAGTITASRAPVFLFVAIAFVLALGITKFWLIGVPSWRRFVLVTSALLVIYIGGWVIGTSPFWYRLPGPYLVSADHRSVDTEGIDAAEWALSYLGPGNRVGADRDNYSLMGTFGNQRVVTSQYDRIEVAQVVIAQQVGPGIQALLQAARIRYLVVDHRLSTALPHLGTYFDRTEPDGLHHTKPIDPAALAKFDDVQNVSRLFDSGNIVIYDVQAISNPPQVISTPTKSLCTTAPPTGVSSANPNLAKNYIGTIADIPTGQTTEMSLTGLQQQGGSICGYFGRMPKNTLFNSIPSNGSFQGTITAAQQIQLVIVSSAGHATLSFDGAIQSDGGIVGTYCSLGAVKGKCSDYGLWSVSPGT